MSQTPGGPGWWQASDGRWYPPEAHPSAQPPQPAPPPALPTMAAPGAPGGPQGPPPAYPPSFPPTVPPGPPGPPPPPPRKGKGWLIALVVVLFAALIGATGAFVYVEYIRDDDDPEISGDPVTLEPVDEIGASPFVTGNAVATTELSSAAVDAANSITADLEVDSQTDARVATGTEPGLYGGTMDEQACDPFALADFLEAEPEKAAAFAGVVGIAPQEIPAYIESLTPVLLTADTWVTNHGFESGEATPFQSVLQAGTAVLIDERGVPRVRCFCGNPLLEPDTQDHTLHATEGEEWDDYEPEAVRRVQGGEEALETVTLLDAQSGEQFDRGLGPGQTGAVQATLRWSTPSDMDLHVIDPNGQEIYFASTTSPSGGELDLDTIPDCTGGDTGPHTENIFWEEDAPPGEYTVFVVDFGACETTTEFSLQVVVGGSTVLSETGTLSSSATEGTRYTFEVY